MQHEPLAPARATRSRLRHLSASTRFMLGAWLSTAAIGYLVVVSIAYFHATSPNALWPDLTELDECLFNTQKPVSRIERLLETAKGDMNRGGTMRPAFTDQSVDWELLTQKLTADERAALTIQREGERLALLDWVRSGASREPYDNDDYELRDAAAARNITVDYLIGDYHLQNGKAPTRIRIRSLIADRCVTCHGENGRHDTARFITLDTYERLRPHLRPEPTNHVARAWLIAALIGLYPLATLSGPVFLRTNHPPGAKRFLFASTLIALGLMSACWFAGIPNSNMIYVLLAAAAAGALIAMVQIIASLGELLTINGISPPGR